MDKWFVLQKQPGGDVLSKVRACCNTARSA